MSTTSGDTMPQSFSDPSLTWTEPAAETASPAADPGSEQSSPAISSEATTQPPGSTETGTAAPLEGGPIPLERHKAILDAQRAESDAKWQRVAWAESLVAAGKTPDQVQRALEIYDASDRNPVEFLDWYYSQLQTHPDLAAPLRSWAGRVLGGRAGAPQVATPQAEQATNDPEPQPDYEQNGVPFYSAPQQAKWQAWQTRQLEARINERINPLIEEREQARRAADLQREQERVTAEVSGQLAELRKDPQFVEHEADIKAYLASKQWKPSIHEAYLHVLRTKVMPNIASTAAASKLAELQTQARASSLNPSSAAPVVPGDVRSFRDPRLKW